MEIGGMLSGELFFIPYVCFSFPLFLSWNARHFFTVLFPRFCLTSTPCVPPLLLFNSLSLLFLPSVVKLPLPNNVIFLSSRLIMSFSSPPDVKPDSTGAPSSRSANGSSASVQRGETGLAALSRMPMSQTTMAKKEAPRMASILLLGCPRRKEMSRPRRSWSVFAEEEFSSPTYKERSRR